MSPSPDIRTATLPAELAAAYAVRHTVFVQEQGVPVELERDDRDQSADHLIAVVDGRVTGAVRLVVEPAGYEGVDAALGPVGHLGRLAVLADARAAGLGAGLVLGVERRAIDHGLAVIYLGSQTHAVGFYGRLGYAPYGSQFYDAGLPHRHMLRIL